MQIVGVVCQNCKTKNAYGSLICEHCHSPLISADMTTRPTPIATTTRPMPFGRKLRTTHEGRLNGHSIAIYVNSHPDPTILLMPDELIFGRVMPGDTFPCFDLSPYGAHERGVSRRHIILKRTDVGITVEDMGSSNGTWINDILMKAYVPVAMQSGDRLRLSQLDMEVYFP
jgi:hypothetical protein